MGIIVRAKGTRYSAYGKDAFETFPKAAALGVGSFLADGFLHDPIMGRLINWLLLGCFLTSFIVMFPFWILIFAYLFLAHRRGFFQFIALLINLAIGTP